MLCSGEFNQDGYIHIILPFLSDPGIPGPIYGSGGSEGGLAKDHTSDFFPATFPAKGRVQKKNAAKVWLENASVIAETNFTFGPMFKTNLFPL